MTPTKRLFPIVSALLLLGLAFLLVPPSRTIVPSVQGTSRTISLVGNYISGWNSSNPTIPVAQGDIVTIKVSSGDGMPHQFWLDRDNDTLSDQSDCSPTLDPCSMTGTAPPPITFTANFNPGTYRYYCTVHPTSMIGKFVVQAPPAPDFSIMSNPPSLTFLQGSSGTSTITLTSINGFSGPVNLAASISPTGPTPSLSSMSVTVSTGTPGTSTLTVSTTSSTLSGTYTVKVNGTSGSTVHTTTVTVQVNAPAGQDFSITSNPASLNVTQGSSSSSTITLTSINGFSGILSLTEAISPLGPSVTFNPTTVSLPASSSVTSMLTVSATGGAYSSVATGSYSLNITASNGSLSHSKIVSVAVSSATSSLGGGGLPVLLVVAAVVIIAVLGVVVYLLRRKPVASQPNPR